MARYDLDGKVALVTGGARGIGFETSKALIGRGASVVVVDLAYRQLYPTLPLHLRDEGMPLGLYAALTAVGSGRSDQASDSSVRGARRNSSFSTMSVTSPTPRSKTPVTSKSGVSIRR